MWLCICRGQELGRVLRISHGEWMIEQRILGRVTIGILDGVLAGRC